jgi:phospholipid N-methyltransferase
METDPHARWHAERLGEITERTGATGPEVFARLALGIACWRNERFDEAVRHLERMLQFCEEQQAILSARSFGNAELAQAWLALDPKRALPAIERALALRETCWDGVRIDLVDARVRLACGERQAAAAAVARGRALMRRLEAPSYEPEFDRLAAALGCAPGAGYRGGHGADSLLRRPGGGRKAAVGPCQTAARTSQSGTVMPRLEKLRLQPDERLAFLQGFLRKPQQVGSVIPSSRFLERKLVELAGAKQARLVVELGPGTGGTTRALLRALPEDAKLLAIEIDPRFARILRETRDPRLVVHEGSAEQLDEVLRAHGLGAPDAVVSGIPFSTLGAERGRRIAQAIHGALAPAGRFIAYQVLGVVHDVARPFFGCARVEVELRNLPPMRIYSWRKGEPLARRRLLRPRGERRERAWS